ncbi:hypothetical protein FRB94_013758 [Tulasnella sp. JGI-2019a]|nr:hypothetical protein FRB94_013758 [Tulasnella sp. JGI-2019a]
MAVGYAGRIQAQEVPEILKKVLEFTDTGSQAASARVNRFWNAVALDVLWLDLEGVVPLLELIGPLELDSLDHLVFGYKPGLIDWDHFHSYARRVRHLIWDDASNITTREGYSGPLSQTMFGDIFADCTRVDPLLPNLTNVKWIMDKHSISIQILPFLSSSTTTLDIAFPSQISTNAINVLLYRLPSRAPMVSDLRIYGEIHVNLVDTALEACLTGMKELRMVTLPRCFGSSKIVTALGRLDHLARVEVSRATISHIDPSSIVYGTKWKIEPGAFTRLQNLAFDATISDAARLFNCEGVRSLTLVRLQVVDAFASHEIQSFFSVLSSRCTQLRAIEVSLIPILDTVEEALIFQNLTPLLKCPHLTQLEIDHPKPMLLREQDVECMSQAWPSIQILRFRSGEASGNLGTPLSILSIFAKHFSHRLQELVLTVSTKIDSVKRHPISKAFITLETLHLDASAISRKEQMAVAAYLGLICPPGVNILYGVSRKQKDAMWNWEEREIWDAIEDGVRISRELQAQSRATVESI